MCQDMAFEGHGSSLGEGHLGQEGSGRGSPGLCLLFLPCGGGNFNTSLPTKDSKGLLLVIQKHRSLACWTHISSTIHRITLVCNGCPPSRTRGHVRIWRNNWSWLFAMLRSYLGPDPQCSKCPPKMPALGSLLPWAPSRASGWTGTHNGQTYFPEVSLGVPVSPDWICKGAYVPHLGS